MMRSLFLFPLTALLFAAAPVHAQLWNTGQFTQTLTPGWTAEPRTPNGRIVRVIPMNFTNDQKTDLLMWSGRDNDIYGPDFYSSNGDGMFTWVRSSGKNWPFAGVDEFIPLDFTGDQKVDLLVRRHSDNTTAFYQSAGNATFTRVGSDELRWPEQGADAFIPMNINNDPKMDFLAWRRADSTLIPYLSNGDGTFTRAQGWADDRPYWGADEFIPLKLGPNVMGLLARRKSDNAAVIYSSVGNGTFIQISSWTTQWPQGGANQFVAGDFNNDQKDDLFVRRTSDNTSVVALSHGDGLFTIASWNTGWPTPAADQFIPGDFDGDQKTDLYVRQTAYNTRSIYSPSGWTAQTSTPCLASNWATLKACVTDGSKKEVAITADISCNDNDSTAMCCGAVLSPGIERDALLKIIDQENKIIRGNGHTITRQGMSGKAPCKALHIQSSNRITVRDLTFQEDVTDDPGNRFMPQREDPTIFLHAADWVTLDYVNVRNGRGYAVYVWDSKHFTLRHSQILDSGMVGLAVGLPPPYGPSRFLTVTETRFENTRTNAVALSGVTGNNIPDNVVSDNVFINNHWLGMFTCNYTSPNVDERCNGGQLYVAQADNIEISHNLIDDGDCKCCGQGAQATNVVGMELATDTTANLTLSSARVTQNRICRQKDWGIYTGPLGNDVEISGNLLLGNGRTLPNGIGSWGTVTTTTDGLNTACKDLTNQPRRPEPTFDCSIPINPSHTGFSRPGRR